MSFCTNCGSKLTEGAKFCTRCGDTVTSFYGGTQAQRTTVYDGEIHKCPNCGEVLAAFTSRCPSCGYELRGAKATGSVQQFYYDLNNTSTIEQETTLIRNFPIPNTKEDIMEFMILAASNFNADSYISESGQEKELSDAWLAKFEQSYQKASLLFKGDHDFAKIQELYNNGKTTISTAVKKKNVKAQLGLILRNIIVCIGAIVLIAAVFVDKAGGNSTMIELIGYIVLIASGASLAKRDVPMIDFAVGAASGLFTMLISVFLDEGSMALLCGGIILIIIAVNLYKKLANGNANEAPANTNATNIKKVKIPTRLRLDEIENYADAEATFIGAGFINIRTVPLQDLTFRMSKKNGTIETITIGGKKLSLFSMREYDPDIPVVITYHSARDRR